MVVKFICANDNCLGTLIFDCFRDPKLRIKEIFHGRASYLRSDFYQQAD